MFIATVQNHSKVPALPVAQAHTVQGKKLLPFFSFDLPNPQPHSRAPWDTGVNPPTLPTPLISLVWWIPLLSCCSSTTEERTPGSLGREGKPSLHLSPVLCLKIGPWKGVAEGKGWKLEYKRQGKGRGYRSSPSSARRVKRAAPGRKTCILSPTWWQSLLKCRDLKLKQRLHFMWCAMSNAGFTELCVNSMEICL